MKLTKRLLSMLLVLCMAFSMLPAMGLTASAATGETYTLYTESTISDGKYIIVGNGNSQAMTSKVTSNWIYPSSSTYTGDSIVDPDDSIVWNISGGIITTADSTVTGNTALYASAAKKIAYAATGTTWTFTNNSGVWNINNATVGSLRFNTTGWRPYTGSTGTAGFKLYKLESGATSYTVTASADPAEGGTVTVSGNTITATPNDGYYVTGDYVAGNGITVTYNNDNTFTFSATADGEVLIEFALKTAATLTYSENGATHNASGTYYVGDSVTLESAVNAAPATYTFMGWLPSTYATNDTAPANLLKAGDSYTLSAADNTLYAVYAIAGEGGTIKLKLNDTTYVGARSGSNAYMSVATTEANAAEFRLESTGTDGEYYIYDVTDGLYIGWSSSTSMAFSSSTSASYIWVYDETAGTFLNKSSSTRYLGYNSGSSRFSTYASSYPHEFTVLGGTSYSGYTTNPVSTKITVTWMNGTDVFKTEKVAYGDAIVAPATNPEKTEEEQQYFTFAGWSEDGSTVINTFPTASEALGDKTYYAVYTTVSKLTVTWNNYDGTTLATEYYKAGETPSYKGSEPTKPADASFYYTFSGWDPTVSPVTAAITYTATFTQHYRFELTASLSKDTVKVSKSAQVNYTLTDMGTATTAFTPSFSVGNSAIASIDANGKITANAVGTTTVTITFADAHDADGNPISMTLNLTVIENTSLGGYTLMTQANSPTDWSGEYIFIGRAGGRLNQLNDLWIMTPKWNADGSAIVEDGNSIQGSSTTAQNNASHIDGLTITDGEATGTINSAYTTGDAISMVATGDNDFAIGGTNYTVLDQITEIPDGYAFEIELVDDVNMYYTIRVKGTSYYLANNNLAEAGNNGLYYAIELADGDLKPLWTIRWATTDDGLTSTSEGYTPDQVMIESVYSSSANTSLTAPIYNRDILFNPMAAAATSGSRFRVYGEGAYITNGNLGGSLNTNNGITYNLFLYGNPNPFSAQIAYNGEQVTLTQHAEVQVGVPTITLDGALLPDIATEPNWSLVSGPTWSLVSTSTSGTMDIDANTGAMTFSGVSANDYAIVGLSYVVHDDINNVNHTVSTQGMVVIIPTSDTYTGIAFEQASGKETETSYTVKYTVNQLPLDFYVKSDSDLTTVYNDGRTSTGSYAIDNSAMSWSVAISSGGGSGATASIANDGDGSATLNMSGFTEDAILTVTVSGVVANGKTVPDFTYKVYVKYVAYTVAITHDGGTTGDFSVSASTTSVPLDKTVTNVAGETPADGTFTTSGGTWAIVGNANGATIDSATGVLDLSGCDRSEEFTLQVIVSGVSATTTPSDGSAPVTTTGLYDTVTITVQAQSVDFQINDDTLVLDYDRSVTFDVLANDNLNGLTVSGLTVTDSNVTVNANNTLTYTPSGWHAATVSFTYTVTLSNGGSASATVNIVPAESVYYEDSNNVFAYTNGKRGEWTTVGTEEVQAQTSSLTSSDIYGYDTNYDSASCAQYSAGSIHKVNVSANNNFSYTARDPYVTFTFVGTGFDVICLNSNDTGAVMVRVLNNDTGKYVVSKVIDTFRGYNYSTEAVEVVGYTQYLRYMKNADGTYTKWDGSADPTEYVYILKNGVSDTTSDSSFTKKALTDFYTKNADGTYTQDNSGTYVQHVTTTNWVINTGLTGDTSAMYQVPLIRETGLGYGNYTVTVTAVYNAVFDYNNAGDYDMYFDAVRIYDPVNKSSDYSYLSFRDELIEDDAFGNGSATPCTHETLGDWEFNTKATYTSSATTNGRGSFVKRCTQCGKICETDYFYVTATADNTELDSQEANSLPATTTLRYTITSDNAEIQAILNALTFDEYWRSSNEAVFTCKNFSSSVRANGAGTTYATLQLTVGTGDARVTYASAIHTPDITVTGCTHTWTTKTTAATCQAEGSTTYTCSVCGYNYSVTLPVVDHSYTYQHNETQHWGACIWCGTTTTAENHNFTAEVTETGIINTCNVCGYFYTTSTTCSHANTYLSGYLAATCTTDGYTGDTKCSDCGETIAYGETIPATGHSYGSATNTGDAATHTYTCSRCGDSYTEDHSFTTSVSGDTTTYTCTLCGYSYAETVSYTLTYVVPTSQTAPAAATGTSATLPSMSNYDSGTTAYTFVGWVATPTSATTTAPTLYAAGSTYSFSADTKLYACYSYDVTSGGGGGDYVKVTSKPTSWAGEYVLVYEANSYILDGSLTTLDAASNYKQVTITDNTISAAEGDPYKITIAASGDAYTIQTVSGYYIGATSNANSLNSSTSTAYTNTISLDADGNATIISSGGAYLRYNATSGQTRFRYYKSTTYTAQKAVALYVKQAGSGSGTTTTYYTTGDAASTTTVTYTVGLVADTTKIEVGGTAYLTATLYADGVAVDGAVPVWTNSQSSVATIETAGEICTVTGVASGTTQVRATFTCPDGSTKYSYKTITVGSTSTGNQPASYSKTSNSGTRGVPCTTLDGTYADSYYTGSYTYENLSSQTGSTLLNTLQNLMTNTHSNTTSYDDCRYNAYKTDCQNGDGTVVLLYTSYAAAQSDFSGSAPGWNREHVWPQSLGGFSTSGAGADMHHIRPDDVTTNSKRGNNKYGEVTGGTEATGSTLVNGMSGGLYGGGYFEPLDNVKGDVARICLYVYTRYNDSYTGTSDITNVFSDIDTLLSWCELDPVDTWEMGRNVVVENTQGNRNVFIDYPELAWKLFDRTVPSGMTTPSGNAASTAGTASAASTVEVAERSVTRATGTANYSGAAFIDGIGNTSSVEQMNKYGPKNEVYLANGQAIVFYLVGDKAVENLQIGAKAANGTAHIKITALNNPDTVVLDKELVTATEMYYEFGSGVNWTGGVSSAIVIENTGSGVLSITNLRYLTADGSLAFYVNSSAVAQTKLLMVTGSSVPETETELPEDDVTPTEPVTPGDVPSTPTEPSEGVVPSESVKPSESTVPSEPEETTDPTEPAEPEYKVEQFKDVSEEDWYYDGVKYAVDSGLMNGVAPDAFAPDDTLTRAMLVTILYRLAGKPSVDEKTEIAFTDVDADGWYYDAVVWAVSNDITNGVSAELFAPDDAVTREQLVTFLWRYKGEPESEESLDSFPDADKVSSFAETAMRWAVENKIVAGNKIDGKDYLDPQGNATRAQIAIIFMRSEKTLD